jgi:hypothetical protein
MHLFGCILLFASTLRGIVRSGRRTRQAALFDIWKTPLHPIGKTVV